MYEINFERTSNSEDWFFDIALVAADDNTPIDAIADNVTITLQIWARTSRGYGDQSQTLYTWPLGSAGVINFQPNISLNTNDGTGQLTLVRGVLTVNVPQTVMVQLIAGFYEVGAIMVNGSGNQQTLFVGVLPIYNGNVFPLTIN